MRQAGNNKNASDLLLKDGQISFTDVYNRYWYKLFLSCYRRVKDKAVAEELVQELFLKLCEKHDTIHIDRIENYLFSSIRNATIDYLKKQMVADKYLAYQKIYLSMARNSTEETVELNDLQENLEKGLQALAGKSEKIFRLRMDHWSVEEIAGHFALSEKTVRYHLVRSQKFLRTYLQQFTLAVILLIRCT